MSNSDFLIDNEYLCRRVRKKDSEGYTVVPVCPLFKVLGVQRDLKTGAFSFKIEFRPFGCYKPETTVIPASDLETRKLQANHLSRGEPFHEKADIPYIIDYIREELRAHVPLETVPVLGWIQQANGDRAFVCGDYAITRNGIDRSIRYSGEKLTLSVSGTLNDAITGLNPFLTGNVALQVAAAFGLSAPLIELLRVNEVNTIVAHLKGQSSTGKTTAASLAVSMFASPEQTPTGLYRKYFQTINSLTDTLAGNHGYPFGLDESGIAEYTSDGTFGYKLASGVEKGRKGARPDTSGYGVDLWRTVIISTGERSIVSDKLDEGARIRIIELNEIWTQSSAEAQSLMSLLKEQYGTVGPQFLVQLLELGEPALRQEYESILSDMKLKAPPDRLSQRLTGTLAIIVTAASLASKLVGLDIDFTKVMDFLLGASTLESVRLPLAEQVAEHLKNRLVEFDGDVFTPREYRKNRHGMLETPVMRRNGVIGKVTWQCRDCPESLVLTRKAYEAIVSEQFDVAVATRALKESDYIKSALNGKTKSGAKKKLHFKKVWISDSIQGMEQLSIELYAKKLGIHGNSINTVEVVTPTVDNDGVVDGTTIRTFMDCPRIIELDGRCSDRFTTTLPLPDPPDEYERVYGEPLSAEQFDDKGEPVEEVEKESICMTISDGRIEYSHGDPF